MSTIRAKFTCEEVSKKTGWGENPFVYCAKLRAVTGGSDENKSFFAATPSGTIEVNTLKDETFSVGKTYYVDFTPEN